MVLSLKLPSNAVVLVSSYPSALMGNDLELNEVIENYYHEFNKLSNTCILTYHVSYGKQRSESIMLYRFLQAVYLLHQSQLVKVKKGTQEDLNDENENQHQSTAGA